MTGSDDSTSRIDIAEQTPAEPAMSESETSLRERADWLRGQSQALQTTVNGVPLESSLGELVRTAIDALGPDTRVAFYLADEDETLHHVVGMSADYAAAVDGFQIGPESLACKLTSDRDDPVLTTDVQTDPRWEQWRGTAERFDYRGCWSFPVHTRSGKLIGTLAVYSRHPREVTTRELELASLLTDTASVIISRHNESEVRTRAEEALRKSEAGLRSLNEALEERVRNRTRELEAEVYERRAGEERIKGLLRRLVNVQEQERRRIARELHDTFGQQLAALHVNIEILRSKTNGDATVRENFERMRESFDRLNASVDFLAWELRPPSLDMLGLDAAMETYVKEWSHQFGVDAVYEGVAVSGLRLTPDAETNLYRIFQEALQNVHKHSGADRVSVVFERSNGQAVLIIEDNGKGCDPEGQSDGRGMGLINMRERAALIGGIVEIESQAGEGTTVFVRVPVAENGNQ